MLDTEIQEQLQKINFPIAIKPIPTIPEHKLRQIRRTDNDLFLSECKGRYKTIFHYDAFNGAIEVMKKGGLDFSNADVKVESYDFGAMAKMEITFWDMKEQVGNHDLYVKYIARNSYNQRWRFQSFFGWLNHVCFNTLAVGNKLAYSSIRHNTNVEIDSVNLKIKNAIGAITDETNRFRKWFDTKISDENAKLLFEKTIAKSQADEDKIKNGSPATNKKQLGVLMDLFEKETTQVHGKGDYGRNGASGSLWTVFQAGTEWSTHLKDVPKDTNKHIIQHKRHEEIRKMISSSFWKQCENA